MKRLIQSGTGVLLFGLAMIQAQAAFQSLYVFGDGLSTTTDNVSGLPYYYGQRYSNGRVWVEVLAQRQGLAYKAANNNSYFDHNSTLTLVDVNAFVPPSDVANDLFVVWVCNSDTYDEATAGVPLTLLQWQASNSVAVANQLQIIKALYAKGVRTLIMPNAVDLSKIPAFNAGTLASTFSAGCVDYNTRFANAIAQARSQCPGLTIYTPDFFSLLNNVLTNAASYGLTNAFYHGWSCSAADTITSLTMTNNPGTNYIFWDDTDPSAKFHAVMADVVQQIISPVQINAVIALDGSNRLDIANVPVGLNGFVEGCTNLTLGGWTNVTNVNSTALAVSVFVPTPPPLAVTKTNVQAGVVSADGGFLPPGGTPIVTALEFYRLHFPFAWNWP